MIVFLPCIQKPAEIDTDDDTLGITNKDRYVHRYIHGLFVLGSRLCPHPPPVDPDPPPSFFFLPPPDLSPLLLFSSMSKI